MGSTSSCLMNTGAKMRGDRSGLPPSRGGPMYQSDDKLCKLGIQVHFRGNNTIHVIYQFKCTQVDWEEEYIGESGRTFEHRLKEYLRAPSPIYQHNQSTGHPINVDHFSIEGRKAHGITRTIQEAMFISVNDPSLNRNLEKYQLPHIRG